jgi:predicted DNA-binding transcriptional regulator YafY
MPTYSAISRILTLLRVLADNHSDRDIESLAVFFGTSEKTIRRDIAELRSHGIVIHETSETNNRKIYTIDKSSLPPLKFNFDEALTLFLGASSLPAFHATSFEEASRSALSKLRMFLGESESKYLDKVLPRIHSPKNFSVSGIDRSVVDELMVAIDDERAIFIEYASAKSTEPLTYDIYPYGMVEHKGSLYVVGHSCHHGTIRTWKVDRILSAELTLFPFQRPENFNVAEYCSTAFGVVAGDEEYVVKVRFTGSAVRYVTDRKYHPTQTHELRTDGSAIVSLELSSLIEIQSWILSFGSAAEVLAPLELRQRVENEVRQLQSIYYNANNEPTHSSVRGQK